MLLRLSVELLYHVCKLDPAYRNLQDQALAVVLGLESVENEGERIAVELDCWSSVSDCSLWMKAVSSCRNLTRSSIAGWGRIFRTVDNGTDDLMDLAIRGGGRGPSLLERLCESWRSLFPQRRERGSGDGRSGRLAQGTGDAAARLSVRASLALNCREGIDGAATDLLSMFADDKWVMSGEKRVC